MLRSFFKDLSIRSRLLLAVWGVLTVSLMLYAYLLYVAEKQEYMRRVDEKLVIGATMARAIVGAEFHDTITGPDSVSTARYLDIVDTYNQICQKIGFQYLWSNLFLEDGSIVFTTATSTSKAVENGDHAMFFDTHSDPSAFEPVQQNGQTTFSSFRNEWGGGRMVLIPFEDAHGRVYVFGASISTQEFTDHVQATARNAALIFVVLFVIGTLVSLWLARAISRPINRLNDQARAIAGGRYGGRVEDVGGGAELVSLAESVNDMSREIEKNRNELEQRVAEGTRNVRNLTRAVEQSPHMVVITDLDGTIIYVNSRFTALTGYTSEEAIGQNPKILQSGDMDDAFYEDMWRGLKTNGQWSGEIKDRRKDGQVFWASMVVSTVQDENGEPTHYVALHEDITERKLAENNIRNAKEQAEAANRAKSEMLANMSHELRTPLNAIIGFSDTIKQQALGPLNHDKYGEYIADIHHSGRHLLGLINDILDVSAIEAGKVELHNDEVDLQDLVYACERLVVHRAKEGGVRLERDVPDDLPPVRVDERRMKQAVLNLMANAVKFTPEGGTVTTSVTLDRNGGVEIAVTDTGIGMDEAQLAKAMEAFGQVDSSLSRKYEGTGLGLPLTKGLIELHGGELVITSHKGEGTCAAIRLPNSVVVN